jgi:hypothetical protein
MVELYCSGAQVENSTASISLPLFFRISMQGSHATSNIVLSVAFVNLEVAAEEIATLRILKG